MLTHNLTDFSQDLIAKFVVFVFSDMSAHVEVGKQGQAHVDIVIEYFTKNGYTITKELDGKVLEGERPDGGKCAVDGGGKVSIQSDFRRVISHTESASYGAPCGSIVKSWFVNALAKAGLDEKFTFRIDGVRDSAE